jgi:hypothetical protein
MNAATKREVDKSIGIMHSDARLAARSLAALHRASNSKTQKEIALIISSHPGISQHISIVNGCFIER